MNILTTMNGMNTHTGRWIVGDLRTASAAAPHEVIKVGGSLLSVPHWPHLVAELVRVRSRPRRVLVVVGGGTIVEGLRTIDAAAPQRADSIHFLAIDLLGTTARLVARALGLPLVVEPGDDPVAVLDAPLWLAATNLHGAERQARLPVGWHVTSDSIAALVAADTGGDLLLAKRTAPSLAGEENHLTALAQDGWVDDHFPTAAAKLARIAWAAPASVPTPGVGGALGQGGDAHGG
jgi:aspartokinase-like uncharacterized kinase